jgi:hypothetical protein
MGFLENFGGANLLTNSKSSALRTMESGFATFKTAELKTKITKDDIETYNILMKFDAMNPKQDGVNSYLRFSQANALKKGVDKFSYLFKFEGNEEANKLAELASTNIFTEVLDTLPVMEKGADGIEVEVMKENQNVMIVDVRTDLPNLRAKYGDDLDFIYTDEVKGYTAYAVKIVNAKETADKWLLALNALAKTEPTYKLKVVEKGSFTEISTITKCNM